MPNALEMLRNDHETVKGLFDKYEQEGGLRSRAAQQAAQQAFAGLLVHAQVEEEFFYPALQDADETSAGLVAEAMEEHRAAEDLVTQLMQRGRKDERYEMMMLELMVSVRRHIEEEESRIFPVAEKALADRLSDLGRRMNSRKQEMMQNAA